MPEIPLTRGGVALVDEEDLEHLRRYSWWRTSAGYAECYLCAMHRAIAWEAGWFKRFPDWEKPIVHHVNRDKLDNRRANLQVLTYREHGLTHSPALARGGRKRPRTTSLRDALWNEVTERAKHEETTISAVVERALHLYLGAETGATDMPIDPRFIINLSGRDYPTWPGILAEAHTQGLLSIETKLLQVPSQENEYVAIVSATALFEGGRIFTEIGDASPRNVNARIATALIRMAATRAKGRALRDAINCGQTMLEELPDMTEAADSALPGSNGHRAPAAPHPAASRAVQAAERETVADRVQQPAQMTCADCGKALTKGQHDVSMRAYGRELCPVCQKAHAKLG